MPKSEFLTTPIDNHGVERNNTHRPANQQKEK